MTAAQFEEAHALFDEIGRLEEYLSDDCTFEVRMKYTDNIYRVPDHDSVTCEAMKSALQARLDKLKAKFAEL